MIINYFFFFIVLYCRYTVVFCTNLEPDDNEVIQVSLSYSGSSLPEQNYALKLSKPEGSVLHPNIKIISLHSSEHGNGSGHHHPPAHVWSPSKHDISMAEDNLYVDHENLAAVRLAWDDEEGKHVAVNGVINGNKVENGNIINGGQNRTINDYLDIGRKFTPSRVRSNTPAVVEVVLVCDKEFGDLFNHDRQRILDYFTVYFWDINMRYKTLPSVQISFQINAIVILQSHHEQPFIEESRASDGRADLIRMIPLFRDWIYGQMPNLPKFDMAIAITNTQLEWIGGYAYIGTTCLVDHHQRRNWGVVTLSDDGAWGNLPVGAHEIGHSLGAPHDQDIPGCEAKPDLIMAAGNVNRNSYFSSCSDRKIAEFVNSNEGSCLRRLDEQRSEIASDFSRVYPPSIEEQCKRRLNNPEAYAFEEDTWECKWMLCRTPAMPNGRWYFAPVDNSPCKNEKGQGRCFRGRCRQLAWALKNAGTGQCAVASNPFTHMAPLEMTSCHDPIEGGSPLEKFILDRNGKFEGLKGLYFKTPFATPNGMEEGDKCIYTGYRNGDWLWTDRCNLENDWQGWEWSEMRQDGSFMLKHVASGRCAKAEGRNIPVYDCNPSEPNMWWEIPELFTPVPVITVG